jgi:ribosomal protein S18 acetylase RimI-like enzyme
LLFYPNIKEKVLVNLKFKIFHLGTELIDRVFKTRKDYEPKIDEFYLMVQEDNEDAIKFYQSCGFVATQKYKNYYSKLEKDGLLFQIIFKK